MYTEIKMTKLVKLRQIAKKPSKFEIILILFAMVYNFRFFIPNILWYFKFQFFPSISIAEVVIK